MESDVDVNSNSDVDHPKPRGFDFDAKVLVADDSDVQSSEDSDLSENNVEIDTADDVNTRRPDEIDYATNNIRDYEEHRDADMLAAVMPNEDFSLEPDGPPTRLRRAQFENSKQKLQALMLEENTNDAVDSDSDGPGPSTRRRARTTRPRRNRIPTSQTDNTENVSTSVPLTHSTATEINDVVTLPLPNDSQNPLIANPNRGRGRGTRRGNGRRLNDEAEIEPSSNTQWPIGYKPGQIKWAPSSEIQQISGTPDFDPERPYGPSEEVRQLPAEPIRFFDLLFGGELFDLWVRNTDIKGRIMYGHLVKHAWKPLTKSDAEIWLALFFSMALNIKSDIRQYWMQDSLRPGENNFYTENMSGERFRQILQSSTIVEGYKARLPDGIGDLQSPNYQKLWKINKYSEILLPRFQKLFYGGRMLCIDESMLSFQGRFAWRQNISTKPIHEGIKLYALCDVDSNYLLNFIVYCVDPGSRFQDGGVIFSYVWTLMLGDNQTGLCSYFGRGFSLVTDQLYSMVYLSTAFYAVKTYHIGTLNKIRGIPDEAKNPLNNEGQPLKPGQVLFLVGTTPETGPGAIITLSCWRDRKKVVRIISTQPDISTEMQTCVRNLDTVKRGRKTWKKQVLEVPQILDVYNNGKSAVDNFNRKIAVCHRHFKTWNWVRPFETWVREACLVNGHSMYNLLHTPLTNQQFRISVMNSLLLRARETVRPTL